jgi:hypothetical protein
MKIVINRCYGGFGLSKVAMDYMANRGHELAIKCVREKKSEYYLSSCVARNDLLLVEAVERLGDEANGEFSELKIVEVPDDISWEIEDYDGKEHVSECHGQWS